MTSLHSILAKIDERVDDQIAALRRRRLRRNPNRLQILPYRSFGTPERLRVAGRVLASRHDLSTDPDDRWWNNLGDMVHRFASQEVSGVTLKATYDTKTVIGTSDNEGYFAFELKPPRPQPAGWHMVDLVATGGRAAAGTLRESSPVGTASATAEVLIPPANAQFGVISDIDDTIVVTHAGNMLKMARMVLLNNARTRLPFPGVAAFYRALQNGSTEGAGAINNPIFYVSSSAWNLYDLMTDFLAHNSIPSGPLLLADYGVSLGSFPFTSHDTHKLNQIERIMSTYPNLPFILVGDSGQRDPAIYRQVATEMPGRVLAIYIRSVTEMSTKQVETIGGKVEMVTADDTLPLAHHALANGWIDAATLPKIDQDAAKDQGKPFPLEGLLDNTK